MSYKIVSTPFFEREFKKLLKKHKSLKTDFDLIIETLIENPQLGESIGNNCYKIRMSITSKNKGKSGGARVITHLRFVDEQIYLLAIYDKSTLSNLAEDQLLKRLRSIQ